MAHQNTYKIMNNSYDSIDPLSQKMSSSNISIDVTAYPLYVESTTNSITDVYAAREADEMMLKFYNESKYYDKYKQMEKIKMSKEEMFDVYAYFRDKLLAEQYNYIEMFMTVCNFFDFNYSLMFNDIISLRDKSNILKCFTDIYGGKLATKSVRLF